MNQMHLSKFTLFTRIKFGSEVSCTMMLIVELLEKREKRQKLNVM